ncbi:unnamed protein product [Chrysodeixis includens]|uniref:Uncharacterized protein n=1 Tax=Chrysodeixis includens TaxID=689277 RepID=A0A9N8L2P4_CHRIL|nr:unnamed protein product [Chrysodeixis includens]
MCCMFTCCGWAIDLVQRFWTFMMSFCISSAVCCAMIMASMSGIALGYNYSLAEYMDLKETNVSVYIKRGVFDDDVMDDLDFRRSGRMPVAGHLKSDNLMTGAPEDESLSQRSGRRLDDSVFEADDQNKYEGSLMKLTARPEVIHSNPPAFATDDVEMGDAYSKYPVGSVDHFKAVQSLIDARRNMASAGTTVSPVATYNINNRNFPMYLDPSLPNARRMMGNGPLKAIDVQPARKAVPDEGFGSRGNWVLPRQPHLFNRNQFPDYGQYPPTYPSPITLNLGPKRTSITTTTVDILPISFATRTTGMEVMQQPTRPRLIENLDRDSLLMNDRYLMEGAPPIKSEFKDMFKMAPKPTEEEYEDEIKGLPVRRRRGVIYDPLASNSEVTKELNATDIKTQDNSTEIENNDRNGTTVEDIISTNKFMTSSIVYKDMYNEDMDIVKGSNHERDIDENIDPSSLLKLSDSIIYSDVPKYALAMTIQETNDEAPGVDPNKASNTLLDRLITATKDKALSLTQDATHKANPSPKNIKFITKRKPFEHVIVSSKYVSNKPKVLNARQTTLGTAELLNSISVSLNEAGLLTNPASSNFVKLLQSTLT